MVQESQPAEVTEEKAEEEGPPMEEEEKVEALVEEAPANGEVQVEAE